MRTPLSRVRGAGSARSGTTHFWQQRLTSLSSLLLSIFLIFYVLAHLRATRIEIVTSMKNPFIALPLAMAILSIVWHMRLGMQVIIEDYIHGPAAKISCLILNNAFSFLLIITGLYAIVHMSFGA